MNAYRCRLQVGDRVVREDANGSVHCGIVAAIGRTRQGEACFHVRWDTTGGTVDTGWLRHALRPVPRTANSPVFPEAPHD